MTETAVCVDVYINSRCIMHTAHIIMHRKFVLSNCVTFHSIKLTLNNTNTNNTCAIAHCCKPNSKFCLLLHMLLTAIPPYASD